MTKTPPPPPFVIADLIRNLFRPRATASIRSVVGAGVFASLVAACSLGGSPSGAAETDAFVSPLQPYETRIFGFWPGITPAEVQLAAEARHRLEQDMVAACMAGQGFNFLPRTGPGAIIAVIGPTWEGTAAEFAATHGFGIASQFNRVTTEGAREFVDPNRELMDQMSATELAAWSLALHGEFPEQGWREGPPEGCYGEAHAYFNFQRADEGFEEFWDQRLAIRAAIDADPRNRELDEAWSVCMAEAGHAGYANAVELSSEFWHEWDRMERTGRHLREPDLVAAFTVAEIAAAVASNACQEAISFVVVRQQLTLEHELAFLERHHAELEAWAALAEARRP